MNAVIFSCTTLADYLEMAQKSQGTSLPVVLLDRKYHIEPEQMKEHILAEEKNLSEIYDTILFAMGFCGGSLDSITLSRRAVIPRVDDCVSLMLSTDDIYVPNRKEMGHLYMMEKDPDDFSFERMFQDMDFDEDQKDFLFHMYFDNYHYLDIVDAGGTDCYSLEYVEKAQKNADLINAGLDYVTGGIHMLEKLVSGRWDDQFVVAEAGHFIRHADFFNTNTRKKGD